MKNLLMLGVLFTLGACSAQDTDAVKDDASKLAKSTTKAVGNLGVTGKVKTVLGWHKGIDAGTIQVESDGGNVTLSGTVKSEEERKIVLATVNSIEGVEKVDDKMTVK